MFRILFWIILFALAFWLWQRFKKNTAETKTSQPAEAEPMVRCAHCGAYLPRNHAIPNGRLWYCNTAHLEQDKHKPHS